MTAGQGDARAASEGMAMSSGYDCHIGQLMRSRDLIHPLASTEERAAVYEALADEVPTLCAMIDALRAELQTLRPLDAAAARYAEACAVWDKQKFTSTKALTNDDAVAVAAILQGIDDARMALLEAALARATPDGEVRG